MWGREHDGCSNPVTHLKCKTDCNARIVTGMHASLSERKRRGEEEEEEEFPCKKKIYSQQQIAAAGGGGFYLFTRGRGTSKIMKANYLHAMTVGGYIYQINAVGEEDFFTT